MFYSSLHELRWSPPCSIAIPQHCATPIVHQIAHRHEIVWQGDKWAIIMFDIHFTPESLDEKAIPETIARWNQSA
jgi:hypothetical protein